MTGADEAGGGVEVVGGAGDSYTGLDAGSSVPGVLAERCGHVLLPGYAILVARALSRSSACSSDLESVVACTETVFCENPALLVLRALCQGRLQRHFLECVATWAGDAIWSAQGIVLLELLHLQHKTHAAVDTSQPLCISWCYSGKAVLCY